MVCLILRTPAHRDELREASRSAAARRRGFWKWRFVRGVARVNAIHLANQLTKVFLGNQKHLFGTNDDKCVIKPGGLTESFLLMMKMRSVATDEAQDSWNYNLLGLGMEWNRNETSGHPLLLYDCPYPNRINPWLLKQTLLEASSGTRRRRGDSHAQQPV